MPTTNRLQKLLFRTLRPLVRRMVHRMPVGDPWEKREARVSKRRFGPGCIKDWRWYFERESSVPVDSVEDICSWLNGCEYMHDHHQFDSHDLWVHPVEFEFTRRGDCEDHALWAWRKLTEIGMPAELVRGEATSPEHGFEGAHAWVHFTVCGSLYVMESTAKGEQRRMIIPHDEARSHYCPEVSVDGTFKTYTYDGAVETLKAKLATPPPAKVRTAPSSDERIQ